MIPWAAYYEKPDNLRSRPKRADFWRLIMEQTKARVVMEVGCGDGLNLEHIFAPVLIGVDSYEPALVLARRRLGQRGFVTTGDARNLHGWRERTFDLTFTCTTLQHIADDDECRAAVRELVRLSAAWVLVMEYEAAGRTPVAWRGDPEGIVKRPWGRILEWEGLKIRGTGFLAHDEDGFDDVTWYLAHR